jgi:hypothetical protein
VNISVVWHFLLMECELIHIFVCKEKSTIILLKILGVNIKNCHLSDQVSAIFSSMPQTTAWCHNPERYSIKHSV